MEHLKNFFNQNYAKLKDLYLSMTFGNRIVATLLAATLLLSLGYLIVGSFKSAEPGSKTVKLYNGYRFDQNDQRAAENALAIKGLKGWQWVGDQLQVPADKKHDYIAALADANVVDKSGMEQQSTARNLSAWDSARLTKEKMLTAKDQDCAAAIKKLPGVADATVLRHIRPAWERNVWARTQIFSVNVTVEAIENKPLGIDTIGAIGRIVAPAFGITDMKEISIVDLRNSRSYNGSGEELSSSQGEYVRHQTKVQEDWNNRIIRHLPSIEGLKVETSIELTKYKYKNLFDIQHGKPTVLVNHTMDYQFHKEGFGWWGRPGQIAQFSRPLIDPTASTGPKDVMGEKKSEQETTNALQGTEMKQDDLPFIPTQITAAIQVPRDYIRAVWKEKNKYNGGDPDAIATPEQLVAEEEIFTRDTKRSIGKLLENYRISNKIDPLELVEIIYYDRLLPEEVVLTAWEQFVLFLQDNWQNLSLMSLVFCGLAVLWAISKPPKEQPIVLIGDKELPIEALDSRIADKIRREEEAAAAAAAAEAALQDEQEEFENTLGELGSLRSLRDEIAELIARNPDAAAAVIRQWVGNASLVEAKS